MNNDPRKFRRIVSLTDREKPGWVNVNLACGHQVCAKANDIAGFTEATCLRCTMDAVRQVER